MKHQYVSGCWPPGIVYSTIETRLSRVEQTIFVCITIFTARAVPLLRISNYQLNISYHYLVNFTKCTNNICFEIYS